MPPANGRLRAGAAGPRQRRNAHRRFDPAGIHAGLRFPASAGPGRSGHARAGQPGQQRAQVCPDRADDRFLRGPAAVFPRRRHRPVGGAWHGQRSGRGRGHAALSVRRLHSGGGPAHGRPAADRGFHARGLRRSGRIDRHGRYQGGRSRQGRPDLHHHHGRGNRARRAVASPSAMPGRATKSWFRARSAIMESRSSRSGKGSNSKRCWKAIPHRFTT